MASSFPTSVDTLKEDFTDVTVNAAVAATWQNLMSQAVKAIQTTLGTVASGHKPQGGAASVGERLDIADFNRAVNGKGFVSHGANANKARPTVGYASYEWVGSVAPNNASNNDTWIQTG